MDDPPKGERIIDEVRVRQIGLFLSIVSKLCDTPKKDILSRRKGGLKGRSLRRLAIHFANFLNSPQWEQRVIFKLDRKQIGQEEVAIARKLELDPAAAWAVDRLFQAMSLILSINVADVFTLASRPPQTRRSVDAEIDAEILVESDEAEKPKPRRALTLVSVPSPDQQRRAQEAAVLVAERDLKAKLAHVETRIRIAKKVIVTAAAANAGKEARDDARAEVKTLDALLKQEKALHKAIKELQAGAGQRKAD